MEDGIHQRENQLLIQQLEFEKILGEVGCAVWKTNLSDGTLLSYSRAAEKILKVNLKDHLGRNFFSLPGFDASRQSLSDLNDGLLKGQTVDKRVLFETPDGEAIWLKIRAKPVQQKTVEGILLDVTTEHAMEERQHCFQDAFEQTEDAIFITDANISSTGPQLIYANAAMLEMSGRDFEELVDETPAELRGENSSDPERQRLRQAMLNGERYNGEFLNYSKDGSSYFAHLSFSPIRNEAGEVTQFLGVRTDITELKDALERAEAANVAKSNFMAVMSHELRTPLNPIIGMTEMLLQETVNEEHLEMLRMIDASACNLQRLIEDILDFTQAEAGKLKIESHPLLLPDLVDQCIGTLGQSFKEKGLYLDTDWSQCPDSLRERILLGDDGRIRQIILNLLANARKFTREGGVTLWIRAKAKDRETVEIIFDVVDTGIGIETNDAKRIFEAFYQVDDSATRAQNGVGIGLAISSEFASRMGGEITVESTPGKGSVLSFRLPLKLEESLDNPEFSPLGTNGAIQRNALQALLDESGGNGSSASRENLKQSVDVLAQKPDRSADDGRTAGKTILLVEDNTANRRYLKNLLTRKNYKVLETCDGFEAIQAYKSNSDQISLILMDLKMPGCNGEEATMQIRALENGGRRMPIVAVTANASEEHRQSSLKSGMDGFLAKPCRPQQIEAVIEEYALA